jgi:hypothetical protein
MLRSSRWAGDSIRSVVSSLIGMAVVPSTRVVPSYAVFQVLVASLPAGDTATRVQRSSAGSPLMGHVDLGAAGRGAQLGLSVSPARRSKAWKACETGRSVITAITATAAAVMAVVTLASQRRRAR